MDIAASIVMNENNGKAESTTIDAHQAIARSYRKAISIGEKHV